MDRLKIKVWGFVLLILLIFQLYNMQNSSLLLISVICIYDIYTPPKLRLDMLLHHILTIFLCVNSFIKKDISREILKIFINTEISTVFLLLHNCKFNHFNWLIDGCFVSSFFYFRIYSLSNFIFYQDMNQFPILLRLSAYGLYTLNCWWGLKIINKLFSQLL